jgi:hypothetical protein
MTSTLHAGASQAESKGTSEAARRIAAALGVSSSDVALSRCATNARGTAEHWYGRWEATPIFAKLLTARTYPVCEPLSDPACSAGDDMRASAEQVEAEWSAVQRLAPFDGRECSIPQLLGRGRDTLVWRRAPGRTLDRLILRSRTSAQAREETPAALRATGAWLRRVHDGLAEGIRSLDLGASMSALEARPLGVAAGRAVWRRKAAMDLLALAARRLPRGCADAPLSFTHGDLTPPNIICEEGAGRVTIVDFEHAAERSIAHDLIVMTSRLRARRLHPLVPDACVVTYERAFWEGYGNTPRDLRITVSGLASAWVFYGYAARRPRMSSPGRVARAIYERLFEKGREEAALRAMRRELEEL